MIVQIFYIILLDYSFLVLSAEVVVRVPAWPGSDLEELESESESESELESESEGGYFLARLVDGSVFRATLGLSVQTGTRPPRDRRG